MEFTSDLQLRSQILALGVTDAELRAAVKRGDLVRVAHGAYLRPDVYDTLSPERRYAMRARGEAAYTPGLVVSHASAAALHGLPLVGVDTRRVHLTRPGRGGSRRTAQRCVHAAALPADAMTFLHGIRVTSLARTLLDVACSEPLNAAVVAADAALRGNVVSSVALVAELARAGHRPGVPAARRAWAQVDGRSESPGDSITRLIMSRGELPEPELQVSIYNERGRFEGRSDLGLLDAGVLLEFDGESKYCKFLKPGQSVLDAVLKEKRREERLTELGWLVIRVIWADLVRCDALVRRIAAACDARRRLVGGIRGTAIPDRPRKVILPR